MPSKRSAIFTAMAAELSGEPRWKPYADWCVAHGNNQPEHAAIAAEHFVQIARDWSFEERKRFSLWLVNSTGRVSEQCGRSRFRRRFSTGGPGLFASRIVVDAVLRPTLAEWRRDEPDNPEPHFWAGLYDENPMPSLREAIRLDPAHGPARAATGWLILNAVDHAQHGLPSGYLGDPVDDLSSLREAEALVDQAVDQGVRNSLEPHLSKLREAAEDWIRLRDQMRGLNQSSRNAIWQVRAAKDSV